MDKLCKDCKYFRLIARPLSPSPTCMRPGTRGIPIPYYKDAYQERERDLIWGSCGPEAKYFEPRKVKDE